VTRERGAKRRRKVVKLKNQPKVTVVQSWEGSLSAEGLMEKEEEGGTPRSAGFSSKTSAEPLAAPS